jgi:hypothetical protein
MTLALHIHEPRRVHVEHADLAGELGDLVADARRVVQEGQGLVRVHVAHLLAELFHLGLEALELREHVVFW